MKKTTFSGPCRSFIGQRCLTFLLAVIAFLSAGNAMAQRLIPDSSTAFADSLIEERLVKLALESPTYESALHQNKINEYQLKAAKTSWLNLLTVSGNYNDQTFAKKDPNNTVVYPKFFTGINIPLGTVFSRTHVKAAREQVEISKNNEKILARTIRAEIISQYKQYKITGVLIRNQQQVVDDYKAGLLQAEKNLGDNKITIEAYNVSSKSYNDEAAKLLNLKLEQELIRLQIEKVIGVSLDTVMY